MTLKKNVRNLYYNIINHKTKDMGNTQNETLDYLLARIDALTECNEKLTNEYRELAKKHTDLQDQYMLELKENILSKKLHNELIEKLNSL